MVVITGYYANMTRSINLIHGLQGAEVLFAATSNCLLSHPIAKDERATNSCFILIGAHQCGVMIVDAG